jgi:alanine dehydrogenase
MKILNDEQVAKKLSWGEALEALELAFRLRAASPGAFTMPERVVMPAPGQGSLLVMPCADADGWFGVKQVSVLPENERWNLPTVQAWYTLFDPSGTPVLACSATLLTRIRTAAASALAARALAPNGARRLLVVGTGSLAPWLAEAHAQVRDYGEIMIWGRRPKKAERTAEIVRERLDVPVEVADELEEAVRAADVISFATTARAPIVHGERLRPGQHLDLVGAFLPEMCEVDAEAVKRASVFVDDLDAAKAEAGDLIQAQQQGWSFERVKGDLASLAGGASSRVSEDEVTLFKSVGLALEDLAVARRLL